MNKRVDVAVVRLPTCSVFLASVKNKLVKICERFSGGVISYRRNVLDIHDRGEKV